MTSAAVTLLIGRIQMRRNEKTRLLKALADMSTALGEATAVAELAVAALVETAAQRDLALGSAESWRSLWERLSELTQAKSQPVDAVNTNLPHLRWVN
jgi:hypothetical protein